jgi:hypothetical protein
MKISHFCGFLTHTSHHPNVAVDIPTSLQQRRHTFADIPKVGKYVRPVDKNQF